MKKDARSAKSDLSKSEDTVTQSNYENTHTRILVNNCLTIELLNFIECSTVRTS